MSDLTAERVEELARLLEWFGSSEPIRNGAAALRQLVQERDEAIARNAAIQGAAEELAHWPELAETPFLVWVPGQDKPTQLRPDQVKGIYESWLHHVETLMPFGREIVNDAHRAAALEREVAELRRVLSGQSEP